MSIPVIHASTLAALTFDLLPEAFEAGERRRWEPFASGAGGTGLSWPSRAISLRPMAHGRGELEPCVLGGHLVVELAADDARSAS